MASGAADVIDLGSTDEDEDEELKQSKLRTQQRREERRNREREGETIHTLAAERSDKKQKAAAAEPDIATSSSRSAAATSSPCATASSAAPLHIVIVSDTHDKKALEMMEVPPPPPSTIGVLVHCGDFSPASATNAWFEKHSANYEYRLVICGNHDGVALKDDGSPAKNQGTHANLERVAPGPQQPRLSVTQIVTDAAGVVDETYAAALARSKRRQEVAKVNKASLIDAAVLLHNSGLRVGSHIFYGTPYNVRREHTGHDGFQLEDEASLREIYSHIPAATTVLLTHCGPQGVLDSEGKGGHLGSTALRERISQLSGLKLHAFGHVHAAQTREGVPRGYEVAAAIPSDLKKCDGRGDGTFVGRDVRAVRGESGAGGATTFANAAGMCIAAGQWSTVYNDPKYGPSDPKVQMRRPLAAQLDADGGLRFV